MRNLFFLAVFLSSSLPVFSQVYLVASVDPGGFAGGKPPSVMTRSESSFENSLSLYFSTATMYEVFDSTSPEREILKYSDKGFYRTELVYLILLASEKKEKFKPLADRIIKGETLRKLSSDLGFDLLENFAKASKIKEEVERMSDDDIVNLHEMIINRPRKEGEIKGPPDEN